VTVVIQARVTSKGQLTLPKKIREALGVGPGDEVAFEIGPQGVTVTPIHTDAGLRKWEGRWRSTDGMTPEKVDQWVADLRGHNETDE
jgi:AbrB family looped-hinge helix DNA binding protein